MSDTTTDSATTAIARRLKAGLTRRNVAILATLLLAYVLLAAWAALTSVTELQAGREALRGLQSDVTALATGSPAAADLATLQRSLADAEHHFARASRRLWLVRPLTPVAAVVLPARVGDLRAVPRIASIGVSVTQAASLSLTGIQPLFDTLARNDDLATTLADSVALLQDARPQFEAAAASMAQAQRQSAAIDRGQLSPVGVAAVAELDRLLPPAVVAVDALAKSPELLTLLAGLDTPRTYLVLLANNDEIRPRGGWISTFGYVTVADGTVTSVDFYSNTVLSWEGGQPSPTPLPEWWASYDDPALQLYGNSWRADFPASINDTLWFLQRSTPALPTDVDAVIALDLNAAAMLVSAFGVVPLPDGSTLTADNLRAVLYGDERDVSPGIVPRHHQYLGEALRAMLDQAYSADADTLGVLAAQLLRAMQQRHVTIAAFDPDLRALAAAAHVDGALRPAVHDYLMVVDASWANKAQAAIEQAVDYTVAVDASGTVTGGVALEFTFPANAVTDDPALRVAEFSDSYLDIMRLHVPANATWVNTTGAVNPTWFYSEGDQQLIGTHLNVPLGETRWYAFVYQTPDIVQRVGRYWRYQLLWQKQNGAQPYLAGITVQLPPNATVVYPLPADGVAVEGSTVVFARQPLATDRTVDVWYTLPP